MSNYVYIVLKREASGKQFRFCSRAVARSRHKAVEHVASGVGEAGEYVAIPTGAWQRVRVDLEQPRASVRAILGGPF